MHAHPEIDVNLTSAWELDLVEMLHSGRIDLALFGVDWENDDLSGMTTVPIHDEQVVASMSSLHPLAKRESLNLSELAALHEPPITKSCVNHRLNKIIEVYEKLSGVTPRKRL